MSTDDLLLNSQQRIQVSMEVLVARLIDENASEEVWETELAQIRYSSEESWEHCNAFLLAHAVARHSAIIAPTQNEGPFGPFVTSFIGAVSRNDHGAAMQVWTDAPVPNPRASAAAKQAAMLSALVHHLRAETSEGGQPQPLNLPGLYPDAVWIEFVHSAEAATDIGSDIA